MNEQLRDYFDRQLEVVIKELPDYVSELLHEVPLIVDDYPSRELMRQLGVRGQYELCGLYQGVPLTATSVDHSGSPTSIVRLFRAAIMAEAANTAGQLTDHTLRHVIRTVILHELGHHHGFDEDELEQLGY